MDSRLNIGALRLVFHAEYQTADADCRHRNQHQSAWDCQRRADEVADALAALPSEPPSDPERLDVERVRKVLFALHPLFYAESWPDDDPEVVGGYSAEDAQRFVAEYARLSDTAPKP